MARYHISPDDVARPCKPVVTGKCRFGDVEHYDTVAEANKRIEEKLSMTMNNSVSNSLKKSASFQKPGELRTISKSFKNDLKEHVADSKENTAYMTDAERTAYMTDAERTALRSYSSYGSCVINPLLVNNRKYTYDTEAPEWKETNIAYEFNSREELKSFMETLDESLKTRSSKERILYRGTPVYSELYEKIEEEFGEKINVNDTEKLKKALEQYYNPGKVLQFDNYLSTTADPEVAAVRAGEILETNITYYDKPEIKGIVWEIKTSAGKDITGISNREGEREITLPRETHFKIKNIEIAPDSYKTKRIRRNGDVRDMDRQDIAIVIQLEEVDDKGNAIVPGADHIPQRTVEQCLNDAGQE